MNTETITIVGAVVLGVLQGLTMWYQRRQSKTVESTQIKVDEVAVKQDGLKRLLDGPMGRALDSLASAKEEVARLTLNESDIQSAMEARSRSNQHETQREEIEQQRRDADILKAEKQRKE